MTSVIRSNDIGAVETIALGSWFDGLESLGYELLSMKRSETRLPKLVTVQLPTRDLAAVALAVGMSSQATGTSVTRELEIKVKELEILTEGSPVQLRYQWEKSLPTIYGPSDFNARVNTHFADEGVIDMYAEYLERRFDLDQTFVAVLEFEKDKAQRKWAIKIEVSQATFGYLHHPSNEEICQQLERFNGKATCLGRIRQGSNQAV
jgi:hypothetical protein